MQSPASLHKSSPAKEEKACVSLGDLLIRTGTNRFQLWQSEIMAIKRVFSSSLTSIPRPAVGAVMLAYRCLVRGRTYSYRSRFPEIHCRGSRLRWLRAILPKTDG